MKSKTVSLTVRLPIELSQKIDKLAHIRHKSVSDIVRVILERQFNTNEYEEKIDEVRQIIRDEVNLAVKSQANRLAAMLTKITVLSASGYFTAVGAVAMLDEDLYSDFESIEQAARKIGLEYAKQNGDYETIIVEFMNKAVSKARKNIKQKKDVINYDYTNFDY